MLSDQKLCNHCNSMLPASSFNRNKTLPDGLQSYCRDCHKAYNAARYQKNRQSPEWKEKDRQRLKDWFKKNGRASNLRLKYGVTEQQFALASAAVGNACEICGQQCETHKKLSVDHDHDTGLVRGLLCNRCNTGLGKFKDSIELLSAAVEYLNRTDSESISILNNMEVSSVIR